MSFPLGCRTLPSGGVDARSGEAEHGCIVEDARIMLLEDQIQSSNQRQQILETRVEGLRKERNEALECHEDLQRRLKESLTAQQFLANQLAGLLGNCAIFPFRPPDDPTQEISTDDTVTPSLLDLGEK